MTAEALLSRLERVKKAGPGRWVASCPTREDRTPSLAVRELDDGRVLVHDFGGESVENILGAVGLSFCDLFPPRAIGSTPERRPFNASHLIGMAATEAGILGILMADAFRLGCIEEHDRERGLESVRRLLDIAEVASVS